MSKIAFNAQSKEFCLTNAHLLAQASELAYCDADEIKRVTQEEWGFDDCRFLDEPQMHTQAFIAASKDIIILCFRGTESFKDWQTDLKSALIDHPHGRVHKGFWQAFGLAAPWVKENLLDIENGQSIWITGHSLGGALATLAADFLTNKDNLFTVQGLYTFGSPRVGDQEFHNQFNHLKDKTFRFVNNEDIVTRIAPRLAGYRHVGCVKYFDHEGKLHKDGEGYKSFLSYCHSITVRSDERYKELKNQFPGGIDDHSMCYYLAHIVKNLKTLTPKTSPNYSFKDYING